MINTERTDKSNEDLESSTTTEVTSLSNREETEKVEYVDRCIHHQSSCEKSEHNIVDENAGETIQNRIEMEKTVIEPNVINSNENHEQNFTEIETSSVDPNTNGWIPVCKPRKKKIQMRKHAELNKIETKIECKNINLSSNLKPERLKSPEQSEINLEKVNTQQQGLHNATNQKVSFRTSKDNTSNETKSTDVYKDSPNTFNQTKSTNRNINQETVKNPTAETHEKLYIRDAKDLNYRGSVKKTSKASQSKQKKQPIGTKINTETSIKYRYAESQILDENSEKCQFKSKGTVSKNSQTQTCQQVESEKFGSVTHKKGTNLYNQTKKNELKQHERNDGNGLKPKPCIIEDEMEANRTFSGKILKDSTINNKQLNENVDASVSTNPKHCNLIKEDITNIEEKNNRKENAEKLNNTTGAKDEHQQTEDPSTEKNQDGWTYFPGLYAEENYFFNQQNNDQILSEYVYFVPGEKMPILPLHPSISNSEFQKQFNGFSTSGIPHQSFDNATPYYYWYQNEFSSPISHDQQHYYEAPTTTGQSSENLWMAIQNNPNFFIIDNAESNDLQNRPFVLSWIDKGVTHFQYYPDFAPISYPCFMSLAGRGCVS